MPGLASSQSKPSRSPVPVQLPAHDWSFSPATVTQWPLVHWESLTQTQGPPPLHVLVVLPLQLPNGQAL
jgi:hypothetical protein